MEFDLRSGDLLYLPRGTIHAATANDTTSVHLTVGVHPLLWSSVIEDAVKRVFEDDVRFRGALPIGFAHGEESRAHVEARLGELATALAGRLSAQELLADAVNQATSIGSPVLMGHLTDLELLDSVDVDTLVLRRPHLRWDLVSDEDEGIVGLEFHNKIVQFPADVADEVRYVAESNGSGITGRGIPGDLDEPGRLVLVQTLVREGFLTVF